MRHEGLIGTKDRHPLTRRDPEEAELQLTR
jgi:hypothetical protein